MCVFAQIGLFSKDLRQSWRGAHAALASLWRRIVGASPRCARSSLSRCCPKPETGGRPDHSATDLAGKAQTARHRRVHSGRHHRRGYRGRRNRRFQPSDADCARKRAIADKGRTCREILANDPRGGSRPARRRPGRRVRRATSLPCPSFLP
jgi:hypothetical protein